MFRVLQEARSVSMHRLRKWVHIQALTALKGASFVSKTSNHPVCMCMCVYTNYMRMCVYGSVHLYMYVRTLKKNEVCVCVCMFVCVCLLYIYTYIYIHIYTKCVCIKCTHVFVRVYMHAVSYRRPLANLYIYIYIYIYIYVWKQGIYVCWLTIASVEAAVPQAWARGIPHQS
jgi:hypothetical protein